MRPTVLPCPPAVQATHSARCSVMPSGASGCGVHRWTPCSMMDPGPNLKPSQALHQGPSRDCFCGASLGLITLQAQAPGHPAPWGLLGTARWGIRLHQAGGGVLPSTRSSRLGLACCLPLHPASRPVSKCAAWRSLPATPRANVGPSSSFLPSPTVGPSTQSAALDLIPTAVPQNTASPVPRRDSPHGGVSLGAMEHHCGQSGVSARPTADLAPCLMMS